METDSRMWHTFTVQKKGLKNGGFFHFSATSEVQQPKTAENFKISEGERVSTKTSAQLLFVNN